MAQLPPIQFQFPPIRYSPIQEAFRGALDASLAQAFLQPFEEKASQRALKREEAFSQFEVGPEHTRAMALGDIGSGRVSEVTDPNELNLFGQAGVAPKYRNFGGTATAPGKDYFASEDITKAHQPASPAVVSLIREGRKRAGFPTAPDPQYQWQAEQQAREGGFIEQFAALRQAEDLHTKDQEDRTLAYLLQPGVGAADIAATWAIKDPKTGRDSVLSPTDIAVLTHINDIPTIGAMPYAQFGPIKEILARYAKRFAELKYGAPDSPLVRRTTIGVDQETAMRELAHMYTMPPSSAESGDLQYYAALAAQNHLLIRADGSLFMPRPDNPWAASYDMQDAFQKNHALVDAVWAWNRYRTKDAFDNARATGMWTPIDPHTLEILADLWKKNPTGVGAAPQNRAPSQGSIGPGGMYVPPQVTPDSARMLSDARRTLTPSVAGQAAPNVDFVGSDQQRAVYQNAFARIKADTAWYGRAQGQMDSLLKAPMGQQVDILRAWTTSSDLKMTKDERDRAMSFFQKLDSMPNTDPQKKTWMRELIHHYQWALSSARDAALNPDNK